MNLKTVVPITALLALLGGSATATAIASTPIQLSRNPSDAPQLVAQNVYSEVYVKNDTGRAIYAYAADSTGMARQYVAPYSTVRMGRTSKRYITVWAIGADYDDTRSWIKKRVDTGNGSEPYTHTFYDSRNTY